MRWYWIDRYTEFVRGKRATAIKCISMAEPHLHDHFTHFPMMPHPLVIEGVAQTGGLLVCEYKNCQEKVVLAKLVKAIFYCEAVPGDVLTYHTEVQYMNENGASITATSHIGDKLHAEFEMMFAYLDHNEFGDKELYSMKDYKNLFFNFHVYEIGKEEDGVTPISIPECFKNI